MEVLTGGGDGITNVDRSSRVITIQSKTTLHGEIVYLVERNKTRLKNHTFFGGSRTYPFEKNKRVPPPPPPPEC